MNHREPSAAEYIKVKRPYLQKRRRLHLDPPYVKVGRMIIYRESDLDAFLEKHLQKPEAKMEPNAHEE